MSMTIGRVEAACKAAFPAHRHDCSAFVRAVAQDLGVALAGDADAIVGALKSGGAWQHVRDGVAARDCARAGQLVVAGLRGDGQAAPSVHGHVVVVVDGPLAHDAYPTAYWGQLGGDGAQARTLNFAWTAADRDHVSYAAHALGDASK